MKNIDDLNNKWLVEKLERNGVQPGDEISLFPYDGKRTELKLLRRSVYFMPSKIYNKDLYPNSVELGHWSGKAFIYQLELVPYSSKNCDGFYKLRCIKGDPFRINGVLTKEAFLEYGDEVEFCFSRIICSGEKKNGEKKAYTYKDLKLFKSVLPIAIEGETGTGKTRLAKDIHMRSSQSGQFVHLNLSSFSSSLIESELFGHVKGAFTGADSERKGALAQANGGTLFLDEIDSLSLNLQTKLLLFLDSGEYLSVGSSVPKKIEIRLIVASGKPFSEQVKEGSMRKDFYFRIASYHIFKLLPLRKRTEEFEKLCQEMISERGYYIDQKLLEAYKNYDWPGNFRELKAHLEKKMLFSKGYKLIVDSQEDDLFKLHLINDLSETCFMTMKELKKNYLKYVLARFENNHTLAAKELGISPSTIANIIGLKKAA